MEDETDSMCGSVPNWEQLGIGDADPAKAEESLVPDGCVETPRYQHHESLGAVGRCGDVSSTLDVNDEPVGAKDILAATILETKKGNIPPNTQIFIEKEAQDFHGMRAAGKQISKDMNTLPHRELMVNAQDGVDLDTLLSPEMTEKIKDQYKTPQNWNIALGLLCIYVEIANRVMRDRPLKSYLEVIVKNFSTVLRGDLSRWIKKQGGWKKYETGLQDERVNLLRVADLYLEHGEPILVMVPDLVTKSGPEKSTEKLIQEINDGFRKAHPHPRVYACGSKDFPTQTDELKFYTKHPHATFVLYFTPSATKVRQNSQYELLTSGPTKHVLVPVELHGLKPRDVPSPLTHFERLQAFPKSPWRPSEVRDFVGTLKGHIDTVTERAMQDDLRVKEDGLMKMQLQVTIQTKKITDHDRRQITNAIKTQAKTLLEDPWTTLRQHLLHMYHVKNIRVENDPDADHLVLEIMTMNENDVEKLLTNYRSGSLRAIFPDHIKMPEIKDPFTFKVWLDEGKTKELIKFIKARKEQAATDQLLFAATKQMEEKKSTQVFAGVLKQMVDTDRRFDVFDLYAKLEKQKASLEIAEVTDGGRNLLHMIVASSRSDCFSAVFYLNLWGDLRLQMIDPEKDTQYGGYTARGLAEKFLFKSKGPKTLEQYDHFDGLWLKMPLLHKACLAGNLTYVRTILEKHTDVNELDHTKAPCILYACASGAVKVVELLIEHSADAKLENTRGESGLFLAAMFGKSAVVTALLQRFDFPKDKEDERKNRAIDYAAMNGDRDTLAAFNAGGMTPDDKLVALAAKYKRKELVQQLVQHYEVGVHGRDDETRTPFLNAAASGDTETMKFLLDHEFDNLDSNQPRPASIIEDRDQQNRNALHMVAENGHVEAGKIIISEAKQRNCLDSLLNDRDFYTGRERLMIVRGRDRGRKAWHYLSIKRSLAHSFKKKMSSGQIDVKLFGEILGSGFGQNPPARFMEDTERDIEARLRERNMDLTPLSMAAYKNQSAVAELLIAEGAAVNTADHFGCNVLHYVAMRGDLELVQKLEKAGVDITAVDVDKKTPADLAEDNEHLAVVNFIRGKELYKHANKFTEKMMDIKQQLSEQTLGDLRSGGRDIRRHLIDTLRDLTIEINKVLLNLGSGPVQEESLDSRNQHANGSAMSAFAGVRPEHAPFPTVVSTVGGGGSNSDDWRRTSESQSVSREDTDFGTVPFGTAPFGLK